MSPLLFAVAFAAELTVTTTSDVTADDGLCSLREAVVAASTDVASGSSAGECGAGGNTDTIYLPAGTYYLDDGQLTMDAPMNLLGDGSASTIIDAQDLSRCIESIVGGSLTIEGLTCRNGSSTSGAGGGMNFRDLISQVSQGNTLTLRDIVVEDSYTNEDGGGIATKGYALTTFDGVTLQRNDAADDGGGLSIPDTADPEAVTYDLTGVRLLNNEAGDDGGGFEGYFGTVSLSDWVVEGNIAGDRAGGLYLWGGRNNVTLERFSIVDNTAAGQAGAIWNGVPYLTLRNLLITGNHANVGGVLYTERGVDIDHITAVGNTADDVAGGLYVGDFVHIDIKNSIFTDNTDGGSYYEGCGELLYYFGYSFAGLDSLGNNVLPSSGWNCETDPSDVLTNDPDLGTLVQDGTGHWVYETNPTSPARSLSDCTDIDGTLVDEDLLGTERPTSTCTSGAFQASICGDGAVGADEECDDGDTDDDDGCSSTCVIESPYACSGSPSVCAIPDTDTDTDGWSDDLEVLCGTDPDDDTDVPTDLDGDGLCGPIDADRDDDGWGNIMEALCGTDPDDDADIPTDNDTDGLCDDLDGDDDEDGWDDDLELLCGTDPDDGADTPVDLDSDDVCDLLDNDADGDGVLSGDETACGTSDLDASEVPSDSDGDGACDLLDPCPNDVLDDSDADGSCDSVDLCTGDDTQDDLDGDGVCGDLDCDDDDGARFPGNVESCDGVDSDCDGTDEVDGDNDGVLSCNDCDDSDPTRYPGNLEGVGDGIDSDCDGGDWCYEDLDADGARTTTPVATDLSCTGAAFATAPYDCDDSDDSLNRDDVDSDGASTCDADPDDADALIQTDGDFFLSAPDVLVVGREAELRVEGATAGNDVRLVKGNLGGTTTWTACGIDVPLGEARALLNITTVETDGTASFFRVMPQVAQEGTLLAVDPTTCEISNAVTFDVHDAE